MSPCQGPWAPCLGKGPVCEAAGDSLGMWGGTVTNGTLVLGSNFVLFWEMAMLVSFCPAEEVWASFGKHHTQLLKRCGFKIDPWPYCPNSRKHIKSHFQWCWFVDGAPIGFHWVCIPPISPKRISWAGDCGCTAFTVSWALHPGGQQWKSPPFPLPKKESLSHTSIAAEVLFCQYSGPWDVNGKS